MKLIVGATDYELKKSPKECLCKFNPDEEHMTTGLCDSLNCEILINEEFPLQIKRQAFWHEVVHAMLEQIGLHDLSLDECFVDAFGKQLYGLHKNNNLEKVYAFLDGVK